MSTAVSQDLPLAQDVDLKCTHCGLPVPRALHRAGETYQFCCAGCETAHAVIVGCGLGEYYKLREALDAPSKPASGRGGKFATFDDSAFLEKFSTTTPNGLQRVSFVLEGIHCGACVWLIEKLPELAPGVVRASVHLSRGSTTIEWDPARIKLSEIATWCDRLGYPPSPASIADRAKQRDLEHRKQLTRLGLAGACAGNAMLASLAIYCGAFDGIDPGYERLFHWVSVGLGLFAVLVPGSVFFKSAWSAIRAGLPSMDIPISLGVGAGTIAGLVDTARGSNAAYFDSLAVLVFLLLLGRYIKFLQVRRAADAMTLLQSVTPRTAHRLNANGDFDEIAIESLQKDDVVEVRPGDVVPADGIIVEGKSAIDRSLLTGESEPVSVGIGEEVAGGAINQTSSLVMRVRATGEQTRVGKLMTLVEEAHRTRPATIALADRLSGWLLIAIVTLAVINFAWWAQFDVDSAVRHTVALLIVACPCALGLATPLAFAVAQGKAAKSGILIQSPEAMERCAGRGRIWLDKTGTITEGKLQITDWMGDESIREQVAAAEKDCNHPIAKALWIPTDLKAESLELHAGAGVSASVAGRRFRIGKPSWIEQQGVRLNANLRKQCERWISECASVVHIAVEGEHVASVALRDRIRGESAAAISELQSKAWTVGMLSGDSPAIARRVASEVGIKLEDVFGSIDPEAKCIRVRESANCETTIMVGDGINDTAALAAATVGISVQGGAETLLHAADVYLSKPGLMPVCELIEGSRRTMRIIRTNFAVSLGYNAIAVSLAMAGMMSPLIAAVLMPISSLTVTTLSLASRSFGEST